MQQNDSLWGLFVCISSVATISYIIEMMKISLHLTLTNIPEAMCAFIALVMYCISLFGVFSLIVCYNKLRRNRKKALGLLGLTILGVFASVPVCTHALVYIYVGTQHSNAYHFFVSGLTVFEPTFKHWFVVAILLFIASYMGWWILFCKLRSSLTA